MVTNNHELVFFFLSLSLSLLKVLAFCACVWVGLIFYKCVIVYIYRESESCVIDLYYWYPLILCFFFNEGVVCAPKSEDGGL